MTKQEIELERIKFEYWKKSKLFKIFWQYFRNLKKYRILKINPSTPFPEELKKLKAESTPYAPKIVTATRQYWIYLYNHDFNNSSFDDYLSFDEQVKRSIAESKNPPPKKIYVENYIELISSDFDYAVNSLKDKKKRTPNIKEFQDYFLNSVMPDRRLLYLKIHQYNFTPKEADIILRQIKSLLKKRTYQTKPEIKALRLYLQAYELREEQKKSYPEIYDILLKNKDWDNVDKLRKAKLYVANARNIIKNLEAGKVLWWKVKRQKLEEYLKQFSKRIS